MPRRKTTREFIEKAKLAHGDRYDYSRVVYINGRTKVEIICSEHGVFRQAADPHSRGSGCPSCGIASRSTIRATGTDKFIKIAKEVYGNRYDYSRVHYVNSKTKVEIICHKHGSYWVNPNDHVSKKSGCPECASAKRRSGISSRKPVQDYIDFSRDGIKWVGKTLPKTRGTKTLWECKYGHTWLSTYSSVVRGQAGCPKCPYKSSHSAEEYRNAYDATGARWVDNIPPRTSRTKTRWQCANGHIYMASYNQVVYSRIKCPHCPKSFAKTIQDYRDFQGKGGVHWIGRTLPKDVTYHTEWECEYGHKWKTSYKSIVNQGTGCPVCQQSTGEFAVKKTLDDLNINYIRQKTFPNCRNKKVLPFDFYFSVDGIEFLVEYDGAQHYYPVDFFGGEEGFKKRLTGDKIKTAFAQQCGFVLIRIPYTEHDNIKSILCEAIEKYTL